MMHQKALLFNDEEVAQKVMNLNYCPSNGIHDRKWDQQMKDIKQLGRAVS